MPDLLYKSVSFRRGLLLSSSSEMPRKHTPAESEQGTDLGASNSVIISTYKLLGGNYIVKCTASSEG